MLKANRLMIGHLEQLQLDDLQSTPVQYQRSFGIISHDSDIH